MAKTYTDKVKCPSGHKIRLERRASSAGRVVATFCQTCCRMYKIKAGPVPATKEQGNG